MRGAELMPRLRRSVAAVWATFLLACTVNHPEGAVPVVWDREACAECRMLVGEPKFAAQLQTRDGDVLNFDDPGCLLHYVTVKKPQVHAIYFHDLKEERWLPQAQVGFIPATPSPMGYGLGAVARRTPGSLSIEQATAQVMKKGASPAP